MTDTTTVHEHAHAILQKSVEQDEWDELPMLFIETTEQTLIIGIAEIHPADFLKIVAAGGMDANIPNATVTGLILFHEGWAFKDPTHEQSAYMQRFSIADHPAGRETKNILSYDGLWFDGAIAWRGEGAIEIIGQHELGGRVPDALKAAFDHLTAR